MTAFKHITHFRWYIGLVAWVAALAGVAWYIQAPLAIRQYERIRGVMQDIAFIARAETIVVETAVLTRRSDAVEEILGTGESLKEFNETEVVEGVYALADSQDCTVGKVLSGDAVVTENWIEHPLVFEGAGSYESLCRFVDGIENAEYSSRVRQLMITSDKEGKHDGGELFLDFVVLEASVEAGVGYKQ